MFEIDLSDLNVQEPVGVDFDKNFMQITSRCYQAGGKFINYVNFTEQQKGLVRVDQWEAKEISFIEGPKNRYYFPCMADIGQLGPCY